VKAQSTTRNRTREAGIALLISIFILLLISIVAIALIVASGTESSLAGNYRSATGVYYAALGGLEEARGRLLAKDPNSFKNKAPATFLHLPGNTLATNEVRYVLNPGPTDGNVLTTYPDAEYDTEFGAGKLAAADVQTTLSVWNRSPLNALPVPGPLYKWVRINAVTEQSLNLDVYPNDLTIDPKLIYYDGTNLNDTGSGSQVLEITSLAVLPNGSQKLLQYLTAPVPIALPPFLAALTLSGSAGNSATFHAPKNNSQYAVKGNDEDCNGNLTGPNHPAIGVFTNGDIAQVTSGIPTLPINTRPNYTGLNPAPDVENISGLFPASLQSPIQLDALAQSIIQNADAIITPTATGTPPYLGTATGADLTPLGMSTTSLLTVVVNGNLDISNWSDDGDGLLLVTGTFTYDPDTIWNGIILVIGQGIVNGSHSQFKQINGAMFVAKTRNPVSNVVLPGPNLGGASMVFNDGMQGNGIRYSSCWIQKAQPTASYKILSFHEISQ
jgi:hypothetical protein